MQRIKCRTIRPIRPRALIPLYAASAVLTLGEGSFALLVPPYMHSRAMSEVAIGAAISAYGLVSLAVRLPAGVVYRPRRAWWLIAAGCAAMATGFALITQTSHPALLIACVALDGAGFAVATTANMAALIERRPANGSAGSIMGWYTGSLGAGYSLAGFLGGGLGDALGPRDAILVLALVPVAAARALSLAVRATAPVHLAEAAAAAERPPWWRSFHGVPPLVWLAFFVTLYINLVSGVVLTFFPLYGLAIGLTLSQIGFLVGIHGAAAAAVRFLSGLVFRWISYEATIPAMVLVSALAVLAIGSVRLLAVLAVAWALLGLARGLLRVSSAALVMDEAGSDGRHGASSGVYLAGLDLGKVLGPIAGGVGAGAVGLRATFLAASVGFPLLYFVLAAAIRRRLGASSPAGAPSTLG